MPTRPETTEPVVVAEKPTRRRWIWITVGIVVALAVIAGAVFMYGFGPTIMDENFNNGKGSFPTQTSGPVQTAYVDNAYQATVAALPASPTYPYVEMNDSVGAMNLQADVAFPVGTPVGSYAGVMAMTSTTQGYILAVGVDGSVVLIKALNLQASDQNEWFQLPPMIMRPAGAVTGTAQPITLRLEISQQGNQALLTAIVNGTTISTAKDFQPYTSFKVIGLYPEATRAGQQIVFDNVVATKT